MGQWALGEHTRAVVAENKRTTAAFVSASAPGRLDRALPVRNRGDLGVLFRRLVCSREAKALYMTGRKPNTEEGFGRM